MLVGIFCVVAFVLIIKGLALGLRYVFDEAGLFAGLIACGVMLLTSFRIAAAIDEKDRQSREATPIEPRYFPKERQE